MEDKVHYVQDLGVGQYYELIDHQEKMRTTYPSKLGIFNHNIMQLV